MWITPHELGFLGASRPIMRVLIPCRSQMRETLRAPPHGGDGTLLQRTGKDGAHIPSLVCRSLAMCVHMFRRDFPVIHPGHAVYALGCGYGGRRADKKPSET